MKASVDKELCIGCSCCTGTCPEVFELGDDDKSQAKVNPVPSEAENSCREAADQCPVSAIKIEEN